ncbi:unnamed protein product [Bubo scandiacus]
MRPGPADQWRKPESRRLPACRGDPFLAERQERSELANGRARSAQSGGEEGKVGGKESEAAQLSIKVTKDELQNFVFVKQSQGATLKELFKGTNKKKNSPLQQSG